jgi:hypothetical protein
MVCRRSLFHPGPRRGYECNDNVVVEDPLTLRSIMCRILELGLFHLLSFKCELALATPEWPQVCVSENMSLEVLVPTEALPAVMTKDLSHRFRALWSPSHG